MKIKALASSSKGNCYWISDGNTAVLLECGLPLLEIQRALGFQLSKVAGCLVSHEHGDHAKAIRHVAKVGVDIFASSGTIAAVGLEGHRLHVIRAREQFRLGTWTVLPFDTVHDATEPLGFLLASKSGEKLLFATDTAYIRYRFTNLTHLMIEANYHLPILKAAIAAGLVDESVRRRILHSHMSLTTALEFLQANDLSKLQAIWLMHLSDFNSDAEMFKRAVQEVTGKPVYVAGG